MKHKNNFSNRVHYILFLTVIVIAIVNSSYLFYSHFKNYTDISYYSFCAFSQKINCDTVSQSPWSIFFGLPLALWGVLSYSLFFILALFARKKISLFSQLIILAVVFSSSSIFFGYISATKIKAYCPLCLFSYCINFTLLYYSWFIFHRLSKYSFTVSLKKGILYLIQIRSLSTMISIIVIVAIILKLFLTPYWEINTSKLSKNINTGFTSDGHPWIGAENPELTIEEFTDYQCFQCSKMHFYLRRIIDQNPERIRLIHRNFPLDNTVNNVITPQPFHVGSGKLAKLAIFAAAKGKFLEMNDALYELIRKQNHEIYLPDLAKKVGLDKNSLVWALQSKEVNEILRRDIWDGMKYGITGTPAFVINGEVYLGNIPTKILLQAIK